MNENYYQENQSFTSDPSMAHGGPNKGGTKTKINNHNMSNEKYNGEKIDHYNIDDATVGKATQYLNSILQTLKQGETKTLSRNEINRLFQN